MQSVRAVVADSGGDSLEDLCRQLIASGISPDTSLDVWRDGVPSFGVRTLREGVELPLGFDVSLRTDEETNMPSDIPNLKQSAAPMPRTEKPAHITTAQGDDDDDEIDLDKLVKRLLDACAEHDIPVSTLSLEEAAEQLLGRTAHERGDGDAGPSRQHLVDDEEPFDDEMVERIMRHVQGKLSPSAAQGLLDLLRGAPADDDMPEGLRGTKEGERLAEYLDGKDRHSFSDRIEAADAVGHAFEMMKQRGALDEPPPFPGRPTAGSLPLPGRQERAGIDRKKRIASDSKFAEDAASRMLRKALKKARRTGVFG